MSIAEGVVALSANFNGGETAVGGVIALYNQVSGVGLLLEGQRDNGPDAATDNECCQPLPSRLCGSDYTCALTCSCRNDSIARLKTAASVTTAPWAAPDMT